MSEGPDALPVVTKSEAAATDPMAAAHAAPRCGARCRDGHACLGPGMRNGRCRMHGGKSTGARTAAGLERCRSAPRKHGARDAKARAQAKLRGEARATLRELEKMLAGGGD
ncbi:hypothetical protein M0638_27350 [Roseomonas sp. NAR14]|uniref:Uncharacterized protein n=1 Tax=Roseomonas acroporae TaxID=2937791 RepID=A0A9X1YE10_9PROT|nr:HGGxSTG domain-containing protein [Roseomonas acroporae]MCK8788077.1 hypothetical protein [Roseomonas acroporae]